MQDIQKQAIPISIACGLIWVISQATFNAGTRISASEVAIQQLANQNSEVNKSVTDLQKQISRLREQVAFWQGSYNLTSPSFKGNNK
jgi:uncharacterized protein YlxW (UPF0749 family)